MYFQFAFALDRVKALAPQLPEWKRQQSFQGVLEGDVGARCARPAKAGHRLQIMAASMRHDAPTSLSTIVEDWIATARHPKIQAPLRRDGLSADAGTADLPARQRVQDLHRLGGGVEFMRPWRSTLWHSAGAGDRQPCQTEVSRLGEGAGP